MLKRNYTHDAIILEEDLKDLPHPVKNWLIKSGMINKPYISNGKLTQNIEMKMQPEQTNWILGNAIQYTTINIPSFIWSVNVNLNKIIKLKGRDRFENGKGEMLIKINSLFNVVNEKGTKIDEAALQRYLGEMVWFPSLALNPYINWTMIDDFTVNATMKYNNTTGSGTFSFNENGLITNFKALRFKDNNANAKRLQWLVEIQEYKTFDNGIKVPSKINSTWCINNENWTWLKLEVTDLKYNIK